MQMNSDFIQVKSLDGELKLTHKKRDFSVTVSTKELVLQKPHVNYHIKLEHIFSIVPFQQAESKEVKFTHKSEQGKEVATLSFDTPQFQFHVEKSTMHNRSGIFPLGPSRYIVPMMREVLDLISEYSLLSPI